MRSIRASSRVGQPAGRNFRLASMVTGSGWAKCIIVLLWSPHSPRMHAAHLLLRRPCRYVFCSILHCDKHPEVPLRNIKRSTEQFLAESGLNFTVFRLCGFMQVRRIAPLACAAWLLCVELLRGTFAGLATFAGQAVDGCDVEMPPAFCCAASPLLFDPLLLPTGPLCCLQAIIGNYAVPILEEKAVWGTNDETRTAYLDSQASRADSRQHDGGSKQQQEGRQEGGQEGARAGSVADCAMILVSSAHHLTLSH